MITIKDGERLYLTSYQYNAARVLEELHKIIINNGGAVEPSHTAIISNRSIDSARTEYERRINVLSRHGIEKADYLTSQERQLEQLNSINNEPIEVKHLTYISFKLDGVYYHYSMDDNPFFPFHYLKANIENGMIDSGYVMDEIDKAWLYDCFFGYNCTKADIIEAANILFEQLVNAKFSHIRRDERRIRVNNIYDDGYHYEIVREPKKFNKLDF